MNVKLQVVRSILRSYPAEWRAQYGEELAELLALRPLTVAVIGDVLRSATRERLRRATVCRISGAFLFVWTLVTIVVDNRAALSRSLHWPYEIVLVLTLVATGCVAALRHSGESPAGTAVKAALLGCIPELAALALAMAGLFHPLMSSGPNGVPMCRLAMVTTAFPILRFSFLMPMVATVLFAAAASGCVFGFLGGLLGRLTLFLSPRLRRS